ncbi:putative dolichol biosynthetic process [Lyophyllum shimeji]|uniref:ditrans,polycis-polyprenyl diphosphate synthase [(2E,6E)-farnesyldiphosphate specific] n=1 Tax=Lyophyllum shimeji TaxID=47721 RepID=A0A9P3PHL9_LYOSH|nr:putative dolichol biosynthetic process [Lyophyllum shimeji]
MALVAVLCLRFIHFIYSLVLLCHSLWKRFTRTPSQPLDAPRRLVPKHLAVVLVSDGREAKSCLVQSVINVVDWCREAGVEKLTMYEEHGKLLECSQDIRDTLGDESEETSSDPEIEYPTPPPSDYSVSRPISPQAQTLDMHTVTVHVSNKQRKTQSTKDCLVRGKDHAVAQSNQKPLTLCLASRESSKPAIAAIAASLVSRDKVKVRKNVKHRQPESPAYTLTIEALDRILESDDALSSPDLMIVHPINSLRYNRTPLELHGYPPWHIRLTEIYHNRLQYPATAPISTAQHTRLLLDRTTFNQALDEFASAEMRFGK